jgi:micrococcal nuclease
MVPRRITLTGLGLALAALIALPVGVEAKTTVAKVGKVVDGDTVSLVVGKKTKKVDLAGIDAPELSACFGKDAAAHLKSVLKKGATVKLKGGELLKGRKSVNRDMVKGGFAHAKQGGGKLGEQLRGDEAAAKAKALGLWKACQAPDNNTLPQNTTPQNTTPPAPSDITGQAAIDQMTNELKNMLFRQFKSGSSSTETWQMNFCGDTRFRYWHEYSYSSDGFFGNTRNEILGKPWTVTDAVIHPNGDRSATIKVFPTSAADSSGPQPTPAPDSAVFDNTGGSWHWAGVLAEGVVGGANCEPVLQHS